MRDYNKDIRNIRPKEAKPYYCLYRNNKFIKSIGSAEKYAKYKKDISKKERELTTLKKGGITTPDMPEGKFNVILADPPWQYDFSVSDSREIENQYPTLTTKQICKLQDKNKVRVRDKVADNAVLYLWATAPKLKEALEVMDAWGFTYKTNAVWNKEVWGMGYWFRGQHELLLIGIKGNFSPPPESTRISSVIKSRRENHSKKPDSLYDLLESQFPEAKFLEVFARDNTRPKWTSWGNNE